MQIPIAVPLVVIILFIFGFRQLQKHQSRNRILNLRMRQNKRIEENKIIIAIQPLDIFANISSAKKDHRYIELPVERTGFPRFVFSVLRTMGKGVTYYKAKDDQKKNNIAFIEALLQTKRVHLVLYTMLNPQVTDSLLKRLDLSKYFKPEDRIFPTEIMKHPTEVDSNTKRIIILTADRKDHTEEDSQYFLVINKKGLKEYARSLTGLINKSQSIDDLHNEFVHWKIEMQSDYDSAQEKTE